ncbi:MAG: FkbM family methyltransferase, partial [Proteobacteria bacterium]|nr:FkbM family methyltransferase [Pseudomonadota bacterium]
KDYHWIFAAGMPRSGSTWVYDALRRIILVSGKGKSVGFVGENDKLNAYLRNHHPDIGPIVLKFHHPCAEARNLLNEGKALAIRSHRDIRDVAVSIMDFQGVEYEELRKNGNIEEILEEHREWKQLPYVMHIRYDRILEEPEKQLFRIAEFIGSPITAEQIHHISEELSLDSARRRIARMQQDIAAGKKKKNAASITKYGELQYDPETLLHHNHIASGAIGRYRQRLTKQQVAEVEQLANDYMVEEGYADLLDTDGKQGIMISYSQNFEDVLLERVFKRQKKGFYIDVGAADPSFFSVTKHFYQRGWNGINIEPIPSVCERLRKERPRDINLQVGLGAEIGRATLYETEFMECSSFDRSEADFVAGKFGESEPKSYNVEIMTLAQVCQQYVKGRIDFLKIDVEGWEEKVLMGADFSRYRPVVILIESTKPFAQVDFNNPENIAAWQQWEPILIDADYLLAYYDGQNRYYIRKEDKHLLNYFSIPIGPFDRFQLAVDICSDSYKGMLGINAQVLDLARQVENLRKENLSLKEKIDSAQSGNVVRKIVKRLFAILPGK